MRTWEYKFIHTSRSNDIVGALNAEGKEGWEAFAVMDVGHDYSVLMRRPRGSDNVEIRIDTAVPSSAQFKKLVDSCAIEPRRMVPRIPPDPNVPWCADRTDPEGGIPGRN